MIRHVEFERLHNFRDLGGYAGADGTTVRWQRLYRSDSLAKLSGADFERYRDLRIRTVIDLRYPFEIEARGRVPEYAGLEYHNFSIEQEPWSQANLVSDDPWRFLASQLGDMLRDGAAEIRRVLEVIASSATDDASTVFHCTSGKDRSGVTAALVLGLLGVSRDDIVEDFALTEMATEKLIADWRATHPGREILWTGFGHAPPVVMEMFLDDLAAAYGSIEGYVAEELKLGAELGETLRAGLLE